MVDKSKKRNKGSISEDNVSSLLQKYPVSTILALLQEVAQVTGDKINWHEMVKNTATGISGAREYQMLWRHLAYCETLTDQSDPEANPRDDDSDLEYELEAFPAVGREASAEAAACVKVLIASGNPSDSHLPNNSMIEAPLTINIPSSRVLTAPSESSVLVNTIQGKNISIPVSVQKLPLSSGEKRPNNTVASGVDLPSKRQRRKWSQEEDTKLAAAVEKYGERNWASIARGDFKNERKPSELSQRWNLRKKQGNVKAGNNSQPSETQLAAAHRAMNHALNMSLGDNLKTAGQSSTDHQLGRAGAPKPQVPIKRPSINPISTSDSMLKAAAVAAGARIATSADASLLIEAARSQNVVHITTGGNSVIKSSTTVVANQLPSNVHFIRDGLVNAPISTYSTAKPNISRGGEALQVPTHAAKSAILAAAQSNPTGAPPVMNATQSNPTSTPVINAASGVENVTTSISSALALPKNVEDATVPASSNVKKELVNGGDQSSEGFAHVERLPNNHSKFEKHHKPAPGNALKQRTQGYQASVQIEDEQATLKHSQVKGSGEKAQGAVKEETHVSSGLNGKGNNANNAE